MFYGDNLKEIRINEEYTQEQVANLINVDKSLYSRYEKEVQLIPLKHLITICDYFGISIDYVFNFSKDNNYNNSCKNFNKLESGKRLKEFRKENKITQDKLASILNTTHSVLSDYERGRYLISTPFLYTICKKYHISADYLLGKIDEPKYLDK